MISGKLYNGHSLACSRMQRLPRITTLVTSPVVSTSSIKHLLDALSREQILNATCDKQTPGWLHRYICSIWFSTHITIRMNLSRNKSDLELCDICTHETPCFARSLGQYCMNYSIIPDVFAEFVQDALGHIKNWQWIRVSKSKMLIEMHSNRERYHMAIRGYKAWKALGCIQVVR